MRQVPNARRENLIVEELPDEVLIYDLTTDKAHCLNQTAALIWKNCDGEKTEGEIAALLQEELKAPMSIPAVELGLEELARYGLLQDVSAPTNVPVSRRRLIQHLGLTAAIALPVIMSLSVPAAAGGGSVTDPCVANPRADGCPCTLNSDCDSGDCIGGICTSLRNKKR